MEELSHLHGASAPSREREREREREICHDLCELVKLYVRVKFRIAKSQPRPKAQNFNRRLVM